jgi:hypothetical protein
MHALHAQDLHKDLTAEIDKKRQEAERHQQQSEAMEPKIPPQISHTLQQRPGEEASGEHLRAVEGGGGSHGTFFFLSPLRAEGVGKYKYLHKKNSHSIPGSRRGSARYKFWGGGKHAL